MQVSVESGEGLQKRLLVDLPAERVDAEVEKKLLELTPQVRLDGFRPGKVPARVIRQRFGDQVRQDVHGELIQQTFYDAVSEQKLMPVGAPDIELRDTDETGGLGYTATFDVMPKVELAELSGKEIVKPTASVQEADVDDVLEKLRQQRSTLQDVERAAQGGDTIYIDFAGRIDGELFEGGSGENTPLLLGSGAMIDGFEEGLIGASGGDERALEVTFPEDYRAEHLAGKAASFAVTVLRVAEPKLPEIDEEFIKAFGVEAGTQEALRAEVHKNISAELEQKLRSTCKDNVMQLLQESNPLDIPQALVTEEAEGMKKRMLQEMQSQGQKSSMDLPADIFSEQAKVRVHLGLLVAELIQAQELTASDEELREHIAQMAQSYEDPQEVIDFYMQDKGRRSGVENLVLENKVVDWVMQQVEVKEQALSFHEVMEPSA